jgi:hypothetical protein
MAEFGFLLFPQTGKINIPKTPPLFSQMKNNFFFSPEFSHFLITNFGDQNIPPNLCHQKVTNFWSKKQIVFLSFDKKSGFIFWIFFSVWRLIKKKVFHAWRFLKCSEEDQPTIKSSGVILFETEKYRICSVQ